MSKTKEITGTHPTPTNSSTKATTAIQLNQARATGNFIGNLFRSQIEEDKKLAKRKKFKGVVLYNKIISKKDFIDGFSNEFCEYVMKVGKTGVTDIQNITHINETIVYVPELSGCLPYPDMTVIEEKVQQLRDEINNEVDQDFAKLSSTAKKKEYNSFLVALRRLQRFPKFYSSVAEVSFSGQRSNANRGEVVMVEFMDDNDWTSSGRLVRFD